MKPIFITTLFIVLFTDAFSQNSRVIRDTLGVDSVFQSYYDNGQLFFQVLYKNGQQNGWYEQYHENGAVWTKEFRINGKTVDGYSVALHDNGNIYQKGFYKNGHEVGDWYCYTSDGKPFKIYRYTRRGEPRDLKVWDEINKKWINV